MSNGVNTLFDVLFHEVMESNEVARAHVERRLAALYYRYTLSQRQALEEVFSELFHVSFATCFHVADSQTCHTEKHKAIFRPT